jgi:Tfp pilus assembly protein PilP
MTRFTLVVVAVLLTSAAFAQAPAATPAPAPPAPAAAVAPADNLPTPPADFSYSGAGRRDPFMALATPRGPIVQIDPDKVRGPQDIGVDELTVRGIVFTNGSFVAMISGAAGKAQTYSVRPGSLLRDGTVRAIDARSIVILQHVSDPLSLQKQREVRKLLRTQEEGK